MRYGDISYSLLVNPSHSHTDESWEGRNTCLRIYFDIGINNFVSKTLLHRWNSTAKLLTCVPCHRKYKKQICCYAYICIYSYTHITKCVSDRKCSQT